MLKKLFIFFLIFSMLITMLVSCKEEKEDEQSTQSIEDEPNETDTNEEEFQLSVEGLDYGNKEIVIHVRNDEETIKEIGIEDDGSALSAELVERTMATEERLHVLIGIAKGEPWNNYSQTIRDLRASIQNGQSTYDIIAGWSPRLPALAAEGLFYNLNQFDYFDSEEEWWSQSLSKSLTFNGKLHLATGDISSVYMDGALVIVFNQALATSLGLQYSDFYKVVNEGGWTIEHLYELTKNVYLDNGNSVRDEGDVFGLVAQEHINLQCFWASSGINIVPNNGVDRPELIFNVEQIQNVFDQVYKLFHGNQGAVINNVTGLNLGSTTMPDYFKEGNALFLITQLGSLASFTDMEEDYGVLPTPKLNSEQKEYYTHLHACTVFSVPLDSKDPEMSAAIMTSLAYDSNQLVIVPHFDKLLKLRYSKDSDTGKMIDLIYNNIYMNFDSIYNEALGTSLSDKTTMPVFAIPTLIHRNDGSSVSSWWQSNRTNLQSKFNEIMDGFFME